MSVPAADFGAPGSASPRFAPGLGRREIGVLGLLVIGALVVRSLHWWQTAMMFNDGPTFLSLARAMDGGRWSEVLAHPYHPFYPWLTLVAHLAVPDWERAAAGVSVAAGGAAVIFLFLFLRSAFDRRAAWLGAALLTVQPRAVSFSGDIQSDGLYLALFLGAVTFLWFALREQSVVWAGCSGLFTGLAYLTRPEGLGVALVAVFSVALGCARGQWRLGRAAGWTGALVAILFLVAAPYVAAMHARTGEWRLSGKKPLTGLLRFEDRAGAAEEAAAQALGQQGLAGPAAEPDADATRPGAASSAAPASSATAEARLPIQSALSRFVRLLGRLVEASSSALRPWFLGLIVLGALARRGRPGAAGELVLLVIALYSVVTFAQLLQAGYLDVRHVLPPLVTTFGYFGAGLEATARGITRLALRSASPPAWSVGALGAVALIAGLGQSLRPEHASARAERAAADWLRGYAAGAGAVAATKSRVGYYAGRPAVVLYRAPARDQLAWLRAEGARYVIVNDQNLGDFPELDAARGAQLALLHCEGTREHWAGVYALRSAEEPIAVVEASEPSCAGSAVALGAASLRPAGAH